MGWGVARHVQDEIILVTVWNLVVEKLRKVDF